MKFLRLLFLIILLLPFSTKAQINNLVPNPSFEDYSNCPDNQGDIYLLLIGLMVVIGTLIIIILVI